MISRAVAVWGALLVLAVLSTVVLCGLIVLVSRMTIGWIRPATSREALSVGALWLALTLAFEFGVGHYGFGKAWSELLADYDLSRGRIWLAVLVVTLLAPLWTARLSPLPRGSGHGRTAIRDPRRTKLCGPS